MSEKEKHILGVDYDTVRKAMTNGYERAAQLPSAGWAAGSGALFT